MDTPTRLVRVHYPLRVAGSGTPPPEMRLRFDADWELDLLPSSISADRERFDFALPAQKPFTSFKPVLRDGTSVRWSQGDDFLAVGSAPTDVHPYFEPDDACHVCTLHAVPSSILEQGRDVRVFLPPGYDENTCERFPVLYMQDGQNLFFPHESFGGKHWRVEETLKHLGAMNLIRKVIVVGVYSRDRMRDYTSPGYHEYGRFLVEELKPWVDERYRTLRTPEHTAVMGSSLGGVVSLHLGWQWPRVFGLVGCMSSTFGFRDDLLERVLGDERRPLRIYLDSGHPRDNFEATRGMLSALLSRGYLEGVDVAYMAFPGARHDEEAWAMRVHLPFQFFFRGDRVRSAGEPAMHSRTRRASARSPAAVDSEREASASGSTRRPSDPRAAGSAVPGANARPRARSR